MRTLVVAVAAAAVLGAVASRDADAQTGAATDGTTRVTVEVRVWQGVEDGSRIAITAWVASHGWYTPRMIPFALDDGLSSTGQYRYGDITVGIPRPEWSSPLGVEVRVWQAVRNDDLIYVSARPEGGSWSTIGTVRLRLDDGFSLNLRERFGALLLEAPLHRSGLTTLAGRAGVWGYADGARAAARFGRVERIGDIKLDVDPNGDVVVADYHNNAIRRVARDGTVTTIWGGTGYGFRDGPTESAQMSGPTDVAVADDGTIYVADAGNNRIRRISTDGIVTTVAGGDRSGLGVGEIIDGPAAKARLSGPRGLALDGDGTLFIMESHRVRRLSTDGLVTTVAGVGYHGYEDGPGATAKFSILERIDVDDHGNVYLIDRSAYLTGFRGQGTAIRTIDSTGTVRTLARWDAPSFGGILAAPQGLAVTGDGGVYLSNTGRHQLLEVIEGGEVRVVAGTGVPAQLDGPREEAALRFPGALALAADGALFVVDQSDSVVRVLVPRGAAPRSGGVAVAGHQPFPRAEGVSVSRVVSGMTGPVYFRGPTGLAHDGRGNVVVATWDGTIRRLAPDGTLTTIAGADASGSADGPGDEARFNSPWGVAVDAEGAIYVADRENHGVRKVATDGSVTTLLTSADGLHHPRSVALEGDGNLLIASSQALWRLDLDDGTVTLVHSGSPFIEAVAVGADGSAFFTSTPRPGETADVMELSPDGVVSVVFSDIAGRFGGVFSTSLQGLAVAGDGTLYVADRGFGRLVRIAPDGTASILLDRDSFEAHEHFIPVAVLVMPDGSLLVSERWRHAIWRVTIDE